MLKYVWAVIVLSLLAACGSTSRQSLKQELAQPVIEPADRSQLYLSLPPGKEVVFLGKISTDKADQVGASMMYPGYSAGSFLAGILVHAAAQSGVEAAEEKRQREAANKILEKYQVALNNLNYKSLTDEDVSIRLGEEAIRVSRYDEQEYANENLYTALVEPVFFVAQNERSLVLSNRVTFKETRRPEISPKTFLVEYVSSPYLDDNPTEYWSENEFRHFTDTAKSIFKKTIHLALQAEKGFHTRHAKKHQTIRYYESGKKKVERGYLIEDRCDRIVFMTLRKSIKSVPAYLTEEGCESAKASLAYK